MDNNDVDGIEILAAPNVRAPQEQPLPRKKKDHRRMTLDQIRTLEARFLREQDWSRESIKELAGLLSLPYVKIYKWNYDRKQKIVKKESTATAKLQKSS